MPRRRCQAAPAAERAAVSAAVCCATCIGQDTGGLSGDAAMRLCQERACASQKNDPEPQNSHQLTHGSTSQAPPPLEIRILVEASGLDGV